MSKILIIASSLPTRGWACDRTELDKANTNAQTQHTGHSIQAVDWTNKVNDSSEEINSK